MNSPDAFAFGTPTTPDDAYRLCKGEAIKKSTTAEMVQKGEGVRVVRSARPAEYLGIMPLLLEQDNPREDTSIGKMIATGDLKKSEEALQQIINSVANMKVIPYMPRRRTSPK